MNITYFPREMIKYTIDPKVGRIMYGSVNSLGIVGYILVLWVLYAEKSFTDPSYRFHRTIAWIDFTNIWIFVVGRVLNADLMNTNVRLCTYWHVMRLLATGFCKKCVCVWVCVCVCVCEVNL